MKVSVNLNDFVWVRLSDKGRRIHREEQLRLVPHREPEVAIENADGWSKWQLWNLMNIFGPYLVNGFNPPFETEVWVGEEAP